MREMVTDRRGLFVVFPVVPIVVIETDAGSRRDLFDQRPILAPDSAGIDQIPFHELF